MPLCYVNGELRQPIPEAVMPFARVLEIDPGDCVQLYVGRLGEEAAVDILFVMPE